MPVPAAPAGHEKLLAFVRSFGRVGLIGVEGTGSYCAGRARHLSTEGIAFREVIRPWRARRRGGKPDPIDASPWRRSCALTLRYPLVSAEPSNIAFTASAILSRHAAVAEDRRAFHP